MLWPRGETELKLRVVVALILVIAGKAILLLMPFAYKAVVDAMSGERQLWGAAVIMVFAYVAARFGGVLTDNLRNAVFEKVGQSAARRLSARVFRHIHSLSLRFHLERRTGSLTKVVERGTKSIDMMLYFLLFNIAPTIIELVATCVIFFVKFGGLLVVATLVMVVAYIVFTRIDHRVAHQAPARDERRRQPGDRARGRQPAQLRNGQIFRRRGARGQALRRRHRQLHARRGAQRDQPRLAQRRAEPDHQRDDGRRDGLHRVGLVPGPLHAGRRGVHQHHADAAVPPARHARLGLSLDPPGADRHGGDVRPHRHAGRDRRRARRDDLASSARAACGSRTSPSATSPSGSS